eukprot:1679807-Rhodomonas_salina.2
MSYQPSQVSADAHPLQCPVLTKRIASGPTHSLVLTYCVVLRTSYAMSDTDKTGPAALSLDVEPTIEGFTMDCTVCHAPVKPTWQRCPTCRTPIAEGLFGLQVSALCNGVGWFLPRISKPGHPRVSDILQWRASRRVQARCDAMLCCVLTRGPLVPG